MNRQFWYSAAAVAMALSVGIVVSDNAPAHAQGARTSSFRNLLQVTSKDFTPPIVFQGSGPNASSIQGLVDQFRLALGGINNASNPGPLASGRREIGWDGGGSATSPGPTPFITFLNRGANILTPGSGFVQAPPSGLGDTFGNPSYGTAFQAFSPLRLFSPIGSNITEIQIFIPGNGTIPALTNGFGVVFADVDQPDGSGPGNKRGNRGDSTLIQFFGSKGELLYSSFVPASPGTGTLSFFAVLFGDARIASVRIRTGDEEPGEDDGDVDIVMMDDFIYGEPKIGG
jgi:hypothetical protein